MSFVLCHGGLQRLHADRNVQDTGNRTGHPPQKDREMPDRLMPSLPLRAAIVSAAMAWLGGTCAADAGPGPIGFQPHRAVYELNLDTSSPGGGVSGITGRIVYELTGSACDGYAQNMRFVTVTLSSEAEGEPTINDLRTSSWEMVGEKLRFSSTSYQNDQLAEQVQGSAMRKSRSDPVRVDVTKPSKKNVEIGSDIYFPIEHSKAVIDAARDGKKIFTANLYDGSEDGVKVYTTTSVIGSKSSPDAIRHLAAVKNGDKLAAVPSWPIAISYFKPGRQLGDALPLYEMSYRFHENGITSELRIDHGEYALKGTLKEIEYLPVAACEPAHN